VSARRPKRIQRQRTKGWRAPEDAVYVGRGTRWGNPFKIGEPGPDGAPMTRADVLTAYELMVAASQPETLNATINALRGRDLMCWCRLDQGCHADVLLRLVNR
jgi:hypothetical protein